MDDCKAVSTPLCPNTKLSLKCTTEAIPSTLYRSIIGSLLYLTASRPDIISSDADWGGSLPDRKSTSGCCSVLGSNVVSWLNKRQDTVSLSTSEAEYIAASQVGSQLLWMKTTLSDLGIQFSGPLKLFCDN
ncbi:uncharacterized mitochondrial protein AtMg00810-like [Cornus florida]|uniref:uncharacterized mitochondrial protein AtMg00810-like n=1 Tax=Cornus florida TaxID=4283 RepID=UPI00289743F2|nr:uncharacterized mitochondrial protein AtMg00810-like [Cornus florida]